MDDRQIAVNTWQALFEAALGGGAAGRVLDVCTGQGGLLEPLQQQQPEASLILGVDLHLPSLRAAQDRFAQPTIQLAAMDGEGLALPGARFDMAVVGVSLHHLERPRAVLAEMMRLLRANGRLVVIEMHTDGETAAQRMMAKLHSWFAQLDRALGISHYPVWSRETVIDLVKELPLEELRTIDFRPLADDLHDAELINQLEGAMDRALGRVEGHPEHDALRAAGDLLRGRLRQHGSAPEPMVALTGRRVIPSP